MIRLQPISTSDLQHYKFMEELLAPEEVSRAINKKQFTPKALEIVEASERIISEWEKGK